MSNTKKTRNADKSPLEFLNTVTPDQKREDCLKLLEIMKSVTGIEPKMWGSIVGFGTYHYKYDSGREGSYLRAGFSPRAQNLTIYVMPGYQDFDEELSRLGKHKMGKSCLYIKHLSDVDESVLVEIISKGLKNLAEMYPE